MSETNKLPYTYYTTPPTLMDLLNLFGDNLIAHLCAHHIGTVQSFDPVHQTVSVLVNYQKTLFSIDNATQLPKQDLVPYPLLGTCPVVVLGGGTTALTMPIQPGDECLVCFNDRDIDIWFSGTNGAGVSTPRLHDLSDGIAIVGLRSLARSLGNYDSTRAMLRAGSTPGSITVVGVNPSNSKVLITNTYPGNSTTLNTLIQQVVTQIKALVTAVNAITVKTVGVQAGAATLTSGTPENSSSITAVSTALTGIATQLGGLLE